MLLGTCGPVLTLTTVDTVHSLNQFGSVLSKSRRNVFPSDGPSGSIIGTVSVDMVTSVC